MGPATAIHPVSRATDRFRMRFDRRAQVGDNLVDASGQPRRETCIHRPVPASTASYTTTEELSRRADLRGRQLSPACTGLTTSTFFNFSVRPFFETVGRAPLRGFGVEGGRS